jgi:hypothetical protein
VTIHDLNKERLRRRKEKILGARDLGDTEADYDSSLNYGENVRNMGLEDQHAPTRKEIKEAVKAAYESNMSNVTGQTYNSGDTSDTSDEDIFVLPRTMKGKGVDIQIDAPILVDREAIKRAILVGLARVAQAISDDVSQNRGGDFSDGKPEGFTRGERVGKFPGSYNSAFSYYSNNKIPYWTGELQKSFVPADQHGLTQDITFVASHALKIENGAPGGEVDGAWVADKLDAYWQTTHSGWSGNIDIKAIHAHPFIAGVAANIDLNMESFGYLPIFADHFCASIKG